MSTHIYYFSGTGNSLYVARELQKRIPDSKLIPVIKLLPNKIIKIKADNVGFVFPSFCISIPIPLYKFLNKADLTAAKYIFAICTRGGSMSEAFEYINTFLAGQKKKINACININMPWNHPTGKENLPAISKEKMNFLESEMQKKLDIFYPYIIARQEYIEEDNEITLKLPSWAKIFKLSKAINFKLHKFAYEKLFHFYSDNKCNGCGICEQVCLSRKIKLVKKRPIWEKNINCYYCFACINYCPQQSIQTESNFFNKSFSSMNARYHHPRINYKDIAMQYQA